MTLFKIILQLIALLNITTSAEDDKLAIDVKEWETQASSEEASKMQQTYAKLHKGVAFRLASPFILIYLKRWADAMLNGTLEDKRSRYDLD